MATQNQSFISQTIKNLSHSETTILTLSVNHRESKHISYGYEIFQTTKVKLQTSSMKLNMIANIFSSLATKTTTPNNQIQHFKQTHVRIIAKHTNSTRSHKMKKYTHIHVK